MEKRYLPMHKRCINMFEEGVKGTGPKLCFETKAGVYNISKNRKTREFIKGLVGENGGDKKEALRKAIAIIRNILYTGCYEDSSYKKEELFGNMYMVHEFHDREHCLKMGLMGDGKVHIVLHRRNASDPQPYYL